MKKNKRYGSQYLVAAGISLLLLTAVFQLSARTLPGFGTWYATIFTRGSWKVWGG